MTTPAHVRYEHDGPLATITLDRPEARNAYSDEMCAQLVAALDRADVDDVEHDRKGLAAIDELVEVGLEASDRGRVRLPTHVHDHQR